MLSKYRECLHFLRRVFGSVLLAISFIFASFKRDRRTVLIGIISVALVVGFAAALQSAVEASPAVFLKFSEDQTGEVDVVLTSEISASAGSSIPVLNFSYLEAELLPRAPDVRGIAPRWLTPSKIRSKERGPQSASTAAVLVALDSKLEAKIGIGRGWKHRALGEGECHVTQEALSELGISAGIGERIVLHLSLLQVLYSLQSSSSGARDAGFVDISAVNQGGGNNSDAFAKLVMLPAILTAVGYPPGNNPNSAYTTISLASLPLLQGALIAAGLPPSALNSTDAIAQTPQDELARGQVRISLAPIILAALTSSGAGVIGSGEILLEFSVVDGLEGPVGKWPAMLGNVVVVEAKFFASVIRDAALREIERFAVILATFRATGGALGRIATSIADIQAQAQVFDYKALKQYAMAVNVVWRDRSWYLDRSRIEGDPRGIIGFTDKIANALGPSFPINIDSPLGDALDGLGWRLFSLFLEQILHASVFVLTLLGILVIYTLVLGDVEAKTYELGMLRALGLRHMTLSHLLILQTAAFSIPGIILGLLLGLGVHYIGAVWLSNFAGLDSSLLSLTLGKPAASFATWLGILAPALAIVVPIRQALSSSLRDSLDAHRSAAGPGPPSVIVERLDKLGLDPIQTSVSLLMIAVGFTVFYLLPLAFILRQLSWFFIILTGILMAMLLGLALVGFSILPRVEHLILYLQLLITCDLRLWTVVKKSLSGHRSRNRKSGAMVGIAGAFLAFASCVFDLLSSSLKSNVRLLLGADVVAIVPEWFPAGYGLPQKALTDFLSQDMARGKDAVIKDFTFLSAPLNAHRYVFRSYLSTLSGEPRFSPRVYGVQANLMDVAFKDIAIVTEANSQGLSSPSLSSNSTSLYANVNPYEDPVRALFAGAGNARLPIEDTLTQLPLPMASGEALSSPAYYCNPSGSISSSSGNAGWSFSDGGWWISHGGESIDSVERAREITGQGRNISSSALQRNAIFDVYNATLQVVVSEALSARSQGQGIVSPFNSTLSTLFRAINTSTTNRNRLSPPSPPLLSTLKISFSDYSTCSLLCNGESIAAAAAAAGGGGGGGACLKPPMNYNFNSPPFPYFGPGTSVFDALIKNSVQGNNTLLTGACWLPSSCSPLPRISDAARSSSIQSSYVNYYDAIVSEALRAASSISTSSALQSTTITRNQATGYVHVRSSLAKIRAQVRKLSPFFFSSYAPTANRAPLILRMQDYARMLDDSSRDLAMLRDMPAPVSGTFPVDPLDDSAPLVPKFRLLVKMTEQAVASGERRQYVVNSIRSAVGSDLVVVQQTAAVLLAANVAVQGLDAFFAFTSTLCLILTFFASWLAFSANVRESQHEFAILRSMLPATAVARCFVHEALAVTLSACILGIIVGLAIATSLVFQFSAFVESSIAVSIPVALLSSFFVSVGFIAITASLEPSMILMRATIASLLKGRAEVL
jgi:hypothetical protein